MRWKTTLVLLALTVGLGAYVSLYELRQPDPEDRERRAAELIEASPEAIARIEVALPEATLTLTREGDLWRLQPQGWRADPSLANRLADALAFLASVRTLTDSPEQHLDLKAYGLEPPLGQVTFVAEGHPTTVWVGERTAVEDNRYAKLSGRPQIFVISDELFQAANQPADTFRDHTLVRLESWHLKELGLRSPALTAQLVHRDNAWWLTQPLEDAADGEAVGALLKRLEGLQIQRVLPEETARDAAVLAGWGLEPPAQALTLLRDGDEQPLTIAFGGPLSDEAGLRYAKRSDEPWVYALKASDVQEVLKTTVEQLRKKVQPAASPRAALKDQPPGAQDPLQHGGMDQPPQDQQRPPE